MYSINDNLVKACIMLIKKYRESDDLAFAFVPTNELTMSLLRWEGYYSLGHGFKFEIANCLADGTILIEFTKSPN